MVASIQGRRGAVSREAGSDASQKGRRKSQLSRANSSLPWVSIPQQRLGMPGRLVFSRGVPASRPPLHLLIPTPKELSQGEP